MVESCASLLESAVLEPLQPVSSIEPASTMLSIAMENFFICVNLSDLTRAKRASLSNIDYYTASYNNATKFQRKNYEKHLFFQQS